MKTILPIIFLVLMEIVLTTCDREFANREFPSVFTGSVISTEHNTIIFSGNIILRNSGEIKEMGFIWQINQDPLILPGFKINIGPKTNSADFQAEISNSVKKGATYVVRAYAITGNIKTFGEKIVIVADFDLPLILNNFEPTKGSASDTIKIRGKWFNGTLSSNQVKIDNLNSKIVEVNDTVLKCIVPTGLRLKFNTIKVVTNGIEGVFNDKFTSLDYPQFGVNKFEPNTGYSGDTIKITGAKFNKTPSLNQVFFNSLKAQIINGNDSVLICIVPPGLSIFSNIKVISNGLTATFTDVFSFGGYHPIGLTKFEPMNAYYGDTIKITGNWFNKTPSLNQVFFNSLSAQIISGDESVLICVVPPGLSTLCNIKVISNGLAATFTDAFTFSGYHSFNGLTAYYPFNGNAKDESGNHFNGSLHGAVLTTDRFNNPNSAYYFDGINDYISILPPYPFIGLNNYTYSLWISPDRVPEIEPGGVIFSVGDDNIGVCQGLTYQFSTCLFAGSYNIGNNPTQSFTKTNPVAPSQWIHIVVTRDNVNIKMYINGILISSTIDSNTNGQPASYGVGSQNAIIGGRCNFASSSYFSGKIDEIRIYNRVLSESEIANL